jgi:hypothetical protein
MEVNLYIDNYSRWQLNRLENLGKKLGVADSLHGLSLREPEASAILRYENQNSIFPDFTLCAYPAGSLREIA